MITYTVNWFDQDSGVTLSKSVTMDAEMLEDIALETIEKGPIRSLLVDLTAWIEIQ